MTPANPANLAAVVAWGAFALAFVFGFVGNRTDFCTMGAISDIVSMGDWNRMRMWLLSIAVAIIGANGLELAGVLKLSNSIYQAANFTWLSYLVGGLLFGIGMTLASGCGSKTLIRVGGGNLKSLVVLVFMAIAAYMTLRGLFGAFRVGVLDPVAVQLTTGQDLPSLLTRWFGAERRATEIGATIAVSGALLGFVFAKREFLRFDYLLGGTVVGLVIVGGWYVSGGFNGPWVVVGPQFVPRPVLLVPVQYYHVPPGHWKQWQRDRPPHWHEEWGREWADKREWKGGDRDRGDRDDDRGRGRDRGHGRDR